MAMVHHFLSKLPSYLGIEDVDVIIKQANDLYHKHPPNTLRSEVRKYLKERFVNMSEIFAFIYLMYAYVSREKVNHSGKCVFCLKKKFPVEIDAVNVLCTDIVIVLNIYDIDIICYPFSVIL